jgi:hypothetical protein
VGSEPLRRGHDNLVPPRGAAGLIKTKMVFIGFFLVRGVHYSSVHLMEGGRHDMTHDDGVAALWPCTLLLCVAAGTTHMY